MDRRTFLAVSLTGIAGMGVVFYRDLFPSESDIPPAGPPETVSIVEFSDSGIRLGLREVPQILKSARDWRRQLTYSAFRVTRRAGTELAFSGAYWNLHAKGLYRCICCDTALFSSDTKFESGTGWPSFWKPIAEENIATLEDRSFGVTRIAVACRRCDAHLGHVFTDGPEPTGLRYCMNSVSMRFAGLA